MTLPWHSNKVSPSMLDNKVSKTFFHLTSVLTDWFPKGGAWLFDRALLPFLGNPALVRYVFGQNLKIVRGVKEFKKLLVVADIHIGDSILAAAGVTAFRDFSPAPVSTSCARTP